MFKIFFLNFGYYSANMAHTLEEAKKIARRAGFQARIDQEEKPVMSFCPWAGFREF